MSRERVPDTVLTAAHDRARARAEGDWPTADLLRAEIEAAGWRIVDRGSDFALSPARLADTSDPSGRTHHGSSASVPSRLSDAPVGIATVVVVATDDPPALDGTLSGVRRHAPAGTSVVVVANAPSDPQEEALDGMAEGWRGSDSGAPEIVWLRERSNPGVALNVGIRRASGPVVIVLGTEIVPTGDLISPLVAVLGDTSVAVAGRRGLRTTDLRRFVDAPPGDVDVIDGDCLAFRRSDFIERGPLDERFRSRRDLAVWWGLMLRDSGEGERPRRAVGLDGLPIVPYDDDDVGSGREDRSRRDHYRILDRFGSRLVLLADRSGDGPPAPEQPG